ncbi:MAG: transcription termination/antitermination NusG family protein [Butyricimonas faecihominis]
MSESTRTLHWYAAYTKINQELTIKKRLDHLEIENYLPMRDEVRETSSWEVKNVRG